MADKKTYRCINCSAYHAQWAGRCFKCGSWNTITEIDVVQKKYTIPKKSAKKKEQEAADKLNPDSESKLKDKWFTDIRKKLTGTCCCGCGEPSQKNDDMYFRASCCHVFPKFKFKSVMYHLDNYVERRFFGGCHSVMDDTSIDRWVNMEDWEDIKRKFWILSPLLTKEEKLTKFYTQLENLVINN